MNLFLSVCQYPVVQTKKARSAGGISLTGSRNGMQEDAVVAEGPFGIQPSGPRERAAPGLGTAPGLASAFDTASGKTANNPLLAVKENQGYGQAGQHCRSRKITPQVVLLIEILLSPHGES